MEIKNKVEYKKLSELKLLEKNPRKISKENMEKLKKSIKENKDYFEARPLIISNRTGENVIIAGNQRYKASKEIGLKEVPCIVLPDLTEEKEKEIIIRDNVELGEFDYDLLDDYNLDDLKDWGVELNNLSNELLSGLDNNEDIEDTVKEINKHLLKCPQCGFVNEEKAFKTYEDTE